MINLDAKNLRKIYSVREFRVFEVFLDVKLFKDIFSTASVHSYVREITEKCLSLGFTIAIQRKENFVPL